MSIIISHPTGNANVRAAALGLAEAGLLEQFYTCLAAFPGDWLYRLGGLKPFHEIRKRTYNPILKNKTSTHPATELGRLLADKFGMKSWTQFEQGRFCVDRVYQDLDKQVARHFEKSGTVKGIYAYEDGALNSFELARQKGVSCLYDLPIGYWRTARRLMQGELENRPEWANTLGGFRDSEEKLARKDRELEFANHIFVASSFTAKSLADYPGKLAPVSIIPYGFPDVTEKRIYQKLGSRKLKLLFVGGLSQRKGLANLLEAVTGLEQQIELTIVGRKTAENCQPLNEGLKKHRWIPGLSHPEVLKLMRAHDILVFPSLFEGFGLVITEAMSQGTPVITTNRTCGADLIRPGENGWLVEAGSTAALRKQFETILSRPEQIAVCGKEAMETARQRPWSAYSTELAKAVKEIIE